MNLLQLSRDRKVSPRGWYQESRNRWIPTIRNSFGLPAGASCPGKTPFCESCYAARNENQSGVRDAVTNNLNLLQEAATVDGMTVLLAEMMVRFLKSADNKGVPAEDLWFRVHWDGDFFSLDYARAWARVIQGTPQVRYWAYTRSFVAPVNVVPILAEIENLSLYLSADEHNIEAAKAAVALYPDVHLALCAVDYESARALAPERRSIVCPENALKMPLMKEGRGACVDCKLCPDGRADVLFATSHREDEKVLVASSIGMAAGECANPDCRKPLAPSTGGPRKWCSPQCRWKTARPAAAPRAAPPKKPPQRRFCARCDVEIFKKPGPGRWPKYCPQCAAVMWRRAS